MHYCCCCVVAAAAVCSFLFHCLRSLNMWEIIRHTHTKKNLITAEEATAWRIRLQHLHEQRKPLLSPQFSKAFRIVLKSVVVDKNNNNNNFNNMGRQGALKRNIRTSVPMPNTYKLRYERKKRDYDSSTRQKSGHRVQMYYFDHNVWLPACLSCARRCMFGCCSNGDCCRAENKAIKGNSSRSHNSINFHFVVGFMYIYFFVVVCLVSRIFLFSFIFNNHSKFRTHLKSMSYRLHFGNRMLWFVQVGGNLKYGNQLFANSGKSRATVRLRKRSKSRMTADSTCNPFGNMIFFTSKIKQLLNKQTKNGYF